MRKFYTFALGILATSSLVTVAIANPASARLRARSMTPAVRSIVPDHGPTIGGTSVTIRGQNVVGVTAVSFGDISATTFSVRSQNTIVATAPPGTGPVDVRVTTSLGVSALTSADQFTYENTPTISNLSPRSGATTGGDQVTISGYDFSGVSQVDFGSEPAASFTVDSNIAVTAVTPAESIGKVDITVTGPDGTSPIDPADVFSFALRIPMVTAVTPDNGARDGGTQVVITGSQFARRGISVDFGPNPAMSFSVLNSQTIMAVSPPGSGSVDVTVTDSRGTSGISSADEFRYS